MSNLSTQQFMDLKDVGDLHTRDFESIPVKHIDREFFTERGEEPSNYDNLKKSIAKEGMKKPIKVVKNDHEFPWLYDGHHRAVIAHELGLKKVPVEYLDKDPDR
jgi:ParB-like chromosome segregation protein Spo0J